MSASPGTRLGPYELLAPIASGGMGHVYRALDGRLSREVAIKILPAEVSADPARLKRFELEARSASALNHPNIVTIYDVGRDSDTSWIAMEKIEGATLRQLISAGRLAVRRALAIAAQLSDGLAQAHEAGIVHRDLKPENVMVTRDGRVKILDFGVAKLAPTAPVEADGSPVTETFPGEVLGTVGYMSPEQAAGLRVDFRSDQFSFGSILYEMLSGARAFQKKTSVETMNAILNEEPPPLSSKRSDAPAPLRWIVERCLSKEPDRRYASTRDLARDLQELRDRLAEGGAAALAGAPAKRRGWLPFAAAILLAAAAVLAAGIAIGRRSAAFEPPSLRRLTFREGEVSAARFGPDPQTIVFSAFWGGRPIELFLQRLDSPESRPLGIVSASLQAISRRGELALLLNPTQHWNIGTLARVGMLGTDAPREVLSGANAADWSPDGRDLAVIHNLDERNTLEYPIGYPLFRETAGFLSHARVSHDGRYVAAIDHPKNMDDAGSVIVVDGAGHSRVVASGFESVWGLAWSPDGGEVWFTAATTGLNRSLFAVTLSGRRRVLARFTGLATLQDVAPGGQALVVQNILSQHVMALPPGESEERELTWLDLSASRAISPDGKSVLILESGEGGGPGYATYLRPTDGSPAVRLGEGVGEALSPDGRWVAAILERAERAQAPLTLYPTGAGHARPLVLPGLRPQYVEWMPDGRRLLLSAGEPAHAVRLYLVDIETGTARPISRDGYETFVTGSVSPDGKRAVVWGPGDRIYLYPLNGGEPAPLPGAAVGDYPCGWSSDGTALYVTANERTIPQRVDRLDVRTGKRELWKELGPRTGAREIHVALDGRAYAYTYVRQQQDLYLVEGLR